MKNLFLFMILAIGFSLVGCNNEKMVQPGEIAIIPKPLELSVGESFFTLNAKTALIFVDFNDADASLKNRYQQEIKDESGLSLNEKETAKSNYIKVQYLENLSDEAYHLSVSKKGVLIQASTGAGAYYALQTLKQLIPNDSKQQRKYQIPGVKIIDKPAFAWRGYMLDVSRHFFDKDKIKEVLDFMAELKLNRFHWHLTDDQGWRIEIKKYPKLTEIGAWRVDHNNRDENISNWWGRPAQKAGEKATYGGFYTQEDIKEIVAYAKARHIEILPEVDVPGHSLEILASYPELACDPSRKYFVGTGGVNKDNALCPSNAHTYAFLTDVLGEVMDLFPLEYIHIGGDECNKEGWKKHDQCQQFMVEKGLKDEHELQSYFIHQVEKIVNAKGKKIIGWNEILQGGLAPNATVMSWQGEKGGITAAQSGHDVIMTPAYAVYLDLKQGQPDYEPNLGYAETLLSTTYNYSVIPDELSPEEASHILGLQGNLWTESISDWGKLTYMTFPRLFAVAENGWTTENNQNFDDFISRLRLRLQDFDSKGVRYAKSVFNPWIHEKGDGKGIEISFTSELTAPEIRYTLDATDPDTNSMIYTRPFTLSETQTVKAAIFENGERLGNVIEAKFPVHKAAGAKVVYNQPYSEKDPAAKERALTDLNYGQLLAKGDKNWQGFRDGFDVVIELEKPTDITRIQFRSLKQTIHGVYPAKQVEVFAAGTDGEFEKIGDSGFQQTCLEQGRNKVVTEVECPAQAVQKIRVKASMLNPIPEGHHKAGANSYLLVDEIVVL